MCVCRKKYTFLFDGCFTVAVCSNRGNYVGQHPYTVGGACTSCSSSASNCIDGLCCKFSYKYFGLFSVCPEILHFNKIGALLI